MARYVSPPVSEFDRLRTKLTDGELRVFHFFDEHLDEDWRIYIQPHMNGLEPDFVLLNPNAGIAVFEVKDWRLNDPAFAYRMARDPLGRPFLVAGKGANRETENPINKVNLYRDEIFSLYCPRLGEKAGDKGFAAVSAGVIFPNSPGDEARELFAPILRKGDEGYLRVSGCDDLESGDLLRIFPEGRRSTSRVMDNELARDFRGWLEEPEFHREQRRPILLNDRQKELVHERTASGYRRVKGPAGSGKSIVIAARAATLALEGKRVLVVCYNMTLVNYLRDLCARWTSDLKRRDAVNKITWIHFHQWCKRTCWEVGAKEDYKEFWRQKNSGRSPGSESEESDQPDESVFDHELSEMVSGVLDRCKSAILPYDAILVDEGQDFLPGWWNVLRKIGNRGGEMLLAADSSQDIYEKARSWTDEAMRGAGFPGGRWFQLQGSYRLPTRFLPLLQDFARSFLPSDLVDIPAEIQQTFLSELEGTCCLRWVQVTGNSCQVCLDEVLRLAASDADDVIPIPDITVLVSKKKDGAWLAGKLEELNIRTIHTFSENRRTQGRMKRGFFKGAARVKITTVHSFKGIESRAMVICLSKGGKSAMALAYTAMTRLKRSEESERGSYLTVVCDNPALQGFGQSWPDSVIVS
jgi:hypothetical protein